MKSSLKAMKEKLKLLDERIQKEKMVLLKLEEEYKLLKEKIQTKELLEIKGLLNELDINTVEAKDILKSLLSKDIPEKE